MSTQLSFLHSCERLHRRLNVLIASIEDVFGAQAALFAGSIYREEAVHWYQQVDAYKQRLTDRQRELLEINRRMERLLNDCDERIRELEREWTDRHNLSREELIDIAHSGSLLSKTGELQGQSAPTLSPRRPKGPLKDSNLQPTD